ncbi:MAG: hypothetical protein JSU07_03755 [Bacteroidetes bacterium]|nr:hypothetical protein [Bacteroidota bacterium]
MYLNTGTISGYAVTIQNPTIRDGYIFNYDYAHYECNYKFIMDFPLEQWSNGWVLRRMLFYILSYPFFKLFGFYIGGVVSAFIITLISFYFFTRFIYRSMGKQQAYIAIALLSSYPGIMYWIGSPFAQTMIVPCCCWLYIIMLKMNETNDLKKHLFYLSIVAILFTAYDLFAIFYPAILLLYFQKKQFLKLVLSLPIMIIPQFLVIYSLKNNGIVEFRSDNSNLYSIIIQSYLSPGDLSAWWDLLKDIPRILLFNFLDSNFWILSILFIIIFSWGVYKKIYLNSVEKSILIILLAIFLFNNAAPVYIADFLMRGEWISRIYQPIFIVLMMYIIRFSKTILNESLLQKRIFITMIIACFALNVTISVGGCMKSKLTEWTWYRFYQHSPPDAMRSNLDRFGVRPIGFPDFSFENSKK